MGRLTSVGMWAGIPSDWMKRVYQKFVNSFCQWCARKFYKRYSSNCYRSIDTLCIYNWNKIQESGNLAWLIRSENIHIEKKKVGKIRSMALGILWRKILDEFIERFGFSDSFLEIHNKEIEIGRMKVDRLVNNDKSLNAFIKIAEEQLASLMKFEEGFFTGTIEQGKQLLEVFNGLEKGIKSLAVESTKYFAISIKTLADLEKRKEALDTIVRLEKANTEVIKQKSIVESALQKLEQEKLKTEQQVEKLEQQRAKTDAANLSLQQKLVKESEKANKERQNSIKNEKALASTYQQNVAALKKVSDRYKELVSRGREGTATGKLLKQEFDRLDGSVRKAEQSVGQFNRSVGNYKDAIKGAIQNTGLANTQLGQLIGTLGELKKKFDESSKSGGSFSDKLKIGVAGGIGIAIGALTALASVNSAVAQGFEKAFAASVGFLTGGVSGAKAAIDFKNALFESYKTLILFGLQLQKVTLDEGDFLDISNDTTIGFKERNAALQESSRLSKERARISLDIAKVELDVINKQVAAANTGIGKADPELLKKQADAQMKVTRSEERRVGKE